MPDYVDNASSAFLAAVSLLPREKYPATHGLNAAFAKVDEPIRRRLAPHLHPLLAKLRVYCVRQTLLLEERLHINPTFKLLLSTRFVPPSLAFIAAAASTIYALRYLYKHSLDLLTNIIGVAYPAYQSIMAIEYGDCKGDLAEESGFRASRALGIEEPNLDKKQWLMYWAIYGVLTTADHWAGPILRLFPMYRFAKIGVLVWAQHRKYNGAAWLYDTFVRPLLPPPPPQQPPSGALRRHSTKDATATGDDYNSTSISKDSRHHRQASIDSAGGSVQEISGQQNRAIQPSSFSFSAMAVASVWDATANVGTSTIPPALTSNSRA